MMAAPIHMEESMAPEPCDETFATDGGFEDVLPEPGVHDRFQRAVPLVCTICPKNSRFSDISHLLTHVSSKGHLQAHFNLRVVRDIDEDAALALDQFDRWFEEYGINALLRERLTSRTQRRQHHPSTPRLASEKPSGGRGRELKARGGRGTSHRSTVKHRPQSGTPIRIDDIKYEPQNDTFHSSNHAILNTPSMASWPNSGSLLMAHQDSGMHATGLTRSTYRISYSDHEEDSSKYDFSDDGSPFPSEGLTELMEDEVNGHSLKLKGTHYPGMGGFDAANEEQRRKRNQRKDPAVLHQLEENSRAVTTNEQVFNDKLSYQRTRDVFDDISIAGSDLENDEEVQEPKRKGRNTNSSRRTTKRRHGLSVKGEDPEWPTNALTTSRSSSRLSQSSFSNRTANSRSRIGRLIPTRSQFALHSHGGHDNLDNNTSLADIHNDNRADAKIMRLGSNKPHNDQGRRHGDRLPSDRLPGLALRPGNPNISFAPSTSSSKRTPSNVFGGKENEQLSYQSPPSTSNPYLSTTNAIDAGTYNPLCVQPRDNPAFRMFSPYDEHMKSQQMAFHPINTNGPFNGLQLPHADYHHEPQHGNDFHG